MFSYKKLFIALFLFILTLPSTKITVAEVITIEFTKYDTYSKEILHIEAGDTVEWLPTNKGHNVEFIMSPQMGSLPKKSKMNEFYSMIFEEPGIYVYGCTPHLNTGMLGIIVVDNDFHNIEYTNEIDLSPVAHSVLKGLVKKAKLRSGTN